MNFRVVVTTIFPINERETVATTGSLIPLSLNALLKAFRSEIGENPGIRPLGRGVVWIRVILLSGLLGSAGFGPLGGFFGPTVVYSWGPGWVG